MKSNEEILEDANLHVIKEFGHSRTYNAILKCMNLARKDEDERCMSLVEDCSALFEGEELTSVIKENILGVKMRKR